MTPSNHVASYARLDLMVASSWIAIGLPYLDVGSESPCFPESRLLIMKTSILCNTWLRDSISLNSENLFLKIIWTLDFNFEEKYIFETSEIKIPS